MAPLRYTRRNSKSECITPWGVTCLYPIAEPRRHRIQTEDRKVPQKTQENCEVSHNTVFSEQARLFAKYIVCRINWVFLNIKIGNSTRRTRNFVSRLLWKRHFLKLVCLLSFYSLEQQYFKEISYTENKKIRLSNISQKLLESPAHPGSTHLRNIRRKAQGIHSICQQAVEHIPAHTVGPDPCWPPCELPCLLWASNFSWAQRIIYIH